MLNIYNLAIFSKNIFYPLVNNKLYSIEQDSKEKPHINNIYQCLLNVRNPVTVQKITHKSKNNLYDFSYAIHEFSSINQSTEDIIKQINQDELLPSEKITSINNKKEGKKYTKNYLKSLYSSFNKSLEFSYQSTTDEHNQPQIKLKHLNEHINRLKYYTNSINHQINNIEDYINNDTTDEWKENDELQKTIDNINQIVCLYSKLSILSNEDLLQNTTNKELGITYATQLLISNLPKLDTDIFFTKEVIQNKPLDIQVALSEVNNLLSMVLYEQEKFNTKHKFYQNFYKKNTYSNQITIPHNMNIQDIYKQYDFAEKNIINTNYKNKEDITHKLPNIQQTFSFDVVSEDEEEKKEIDSPKEYSPKLTKKKSSTNTSHIKEPSYEQVEFALKPLLNLVTLTTTITDNITKPNIKPNYSVDSLMATNNNVGKKKDKKQIHAQKDLLTCFNMETNVNNVDIELTLQTIENQQEEATYSLPQILHNALIYYQDTEPRCSVLGFITERASKQTKNNETFYKNLEINYLFGYFFKHLEYICIKNNFKLSNETIDYQDTQDNANNFYNIFLNTKNIYIDSYFESLITTLLETLVIYQDIHNNIPQSNQYTKRHDLTINILDKYITYRRRLMSLTFATNLLKKNKKQTNNVVEYIREFGDKLWNVIFTVDQYKHMFHQDDKESCTKSYLHFLDSNNQYIDSNVKNRLNILSIQSSILLSNEQFIHHEKAIIKNIIHTHDVINAIYISHRLPTKKTNDILNSSDILQFVYPLNGLIPTSLIDYNDPANTKEEISGVQELLKCVRVIFLCLEIINGNKLYAKFVLNTILDKSTDVSKKLLDDKFENLNQLLNTLFTKQTELTPINTKIINILKILREYLLPVRSIYGNYMGAINDINTMEDLCQ